MMIVDEVEYNIGRSRRMDSPDVMVTKNECCILFESKASVPSTELWKFNENSYNDTICRYVDCVKQVYKSIKDFNVHYYPFKEKKTYKTENIFGVIVWLEETYLPRDIIYAEVSKVLRKEFDSEEMRFIRSNIKMVSLRDIEESALFGIDYLVALENQRNNERKWNDPMLTIKDGEKREYITEVQKVNKRINEGAINLLKSIG